MAGGIPITCAAGGPSRRTKKCRPRATPWKLIDVSAHEPRRIPSKKWRELIKKVWEAGRKRHAAHHY